MEAEIENNWSFSIYTFYYHAFPQPFSLVKHINCIYFTNIFKNFQNPSVPGDPGDI